MHFIQNVISNLDCQKKTFSELFITLVSRMGWQGRYKTARKDKIVSLLPCMNFVCIQNDFLKSGTIKSLTQCSVVMYQNVFCAAGWPCIAICTIFKVGAKEVVVSVKLKGLEIALLAQLLQNQVRCLSGSFSCCYQRVFWVNFTRLLMLRLCYPNTMLVWHAVGYWCQVLKWFCRY